MKSARTYSDVYRYWHAIEYLLAQHRAATPAVQWLSLGQAVSMAAEEVPAARVILPAEVAQLDAALRDIEPEALSPHYERRCPGSSGHLPPPLEGMGGNLRSVGAGSGALLFLQNSVKRCASAGDALVLYFVDDGEDC